MSDFGRASEKVPPLAGCGVWEYAVGLGTYARRAVSRSMKPFTTESENFPPFTIFERLLLTTSYVFGPGRDRASRMMVSRYDGGFDFEILHALPPLPTPRREYVFGAGFSRARAIAQSKVVFSVPLGIAHDPNVRREDSTCRPKLPGNAVALILAYIPLPAGVRAR